MKYIIIKCYTYCIAFIIMFRSKNDNFDSSSDIELNFMDMVSIKPSKVHEHGIINSKTLDNYAKISTIKKTIGDKQVVYYIDESELLKLSNNKDETLYFKLVNTTNDLYKQYNRPRPHKKAVYKSNLSDSDEVVKKKQSSEATTSHSSSEESPKPCRKK